MRLGGISRGSRGRTHFLSLVEYLLTETSRRSPVGLATPLPGRSSSMRSLGENMFAASLKVKSVVFGTAIVVCCREVVVGARGAWAAKPRRESETLKEGSHMVGNWFA